MEFNTIYQVFRMGLEHRVISKNAIVTWADTQINANPGLENMVYDLSCCGSKSEEEIINILSGAIHENESAIPTRVVFGTLHQAYKKKNISLISAAEIISRIGKEKLLTESEQKSTMNIDDALSMAEQEVRGTIAEIENETLRFLSRYSSFTIDNFEHWNSLNASMKF
jgi:hypothetical protein